MASGLRTLAISAAWCVAIYHGPIIARRLFFAGMRRGEHKIAAQKLKNSTEVQDKA